MSKAHGFIMDSTLTYKKRYWQVFSDKIRKKYIEAQKESKSILYSKYKYNPIIL